MVSRSYKFKEKRLPKAASALLLASTALTLGACATLPTPAKHEAPKAVSAYATERSFAAPSAAGWPADHWWEEFSDPQLSALITEGVAGASDMRIANARFAAAQAVVGEARSALMPSINAEGAVIEVKPSQELFQTRTNGWNAVGDVSLSGSWTIDFWGKNRAALRSTQDLARAAEAEAAQARLAVSTGIAGAYANLASLYQERDAADDALNVRRKTAALMEDRRQHQLENQGAVARARSNEAAAEAELAAIDEAIAINRNQIAALMGEGPDRGLAIQRPGLPATTAFGLPEHLPAELLGRRPDVVAARYRVSAAAEHIKQAKAGFYPNVDLVGLAGVQSLGISNLFTSNAKYGAVGPAISLPIFDGGRLRAQYRGAEADYAEAVAAYDGTLTNALSEVADVTASSRALDNRLDSSREAEKEAQAAWVIANNRYRGGLSTYLDVLTAEDALIRARRAVADLNARAFTLDVALIRALGGGYNHA